MNLTLNKLQTQKLILTASIQQSIAVLLLPHTELCASIEQELQNNPLLEVIEPLEQPPLINSNRTHEEFNAESFSMVETMSLEDHLYQQLFWEVSDPLKRKIGEFIIGSLDKDGYLSLSAQEIATSLHLESAAAVQEVLGIIQNFDPQGIATKDFKESLIIQMNSRQSPLKSVAIEIIKEYLDDLGHKRYATISKKLSVPVEDIIEAGRLIAALEPKPARNYRPIDPTVYIQPDVYVLKDEEGNYIVETNKRQMPSLRVSQTYRDLLQQPKLSQHERQFIKEKLENALNFIKSLKQRGETLKKIAQYILEHQKEFFQGQEAFLEPMSLKDVALHLDRNESTISRAISNKYIDTPQGIFPLKFFFSHNVASGSNGKTSAHTVKEEIAQLIEEENKESPLSDQDIQAHFNAKGLRLARRTITKYRQMLDIPASHLRK